MKILDYLKKFFKKPKEIRYDIIMPIMPDNYLKKKIEQIIKNETGEDADVKITIYF